MRLQHLLAAACALLFFVSKSASQTSFRDPATLKWGFRDEDWNFIIPPIYDEMQPNFDTIIAVKKDGMTGALDDRGNIRIPLVFHEIMPNLSPFRTQFGFAAATKDRNARNTWGMIDGRGREVLPAKFEYVRAVSPTLLVGRVDGDSILQFYDQRGAFRFSMPGRRVEPNDVDDASGAPTSFLVLGIRPRVLRGVKMDGSWVYPPAPEEGIWTDGKLSILRRASGVGLVNQQGDVLIPFEFSRIRLGLPGHFIAEKLDGSTYQRGVFDAMGKVIIPLSRQGIHPLDGTYLVGNDEGEGIFSREGRAILPAKYEFGRAYIPSDYGKIPNSHPERYFEVRDKGPRQHGIYRKDGTEITPIKYFDVRYYSEEHPILAALPLMPGENFERQFALDFRGQPLLPTGYFSLDFTADPRVLLGSKTVLGARGFISLDAPEQAEFVYEWLVRMPNGYFRGKKGDRHALFSPSAKLLREDAFTGMGDPSKEDFETFRATKGTSGRLVAVASRRDWSFPKFIGINERGEIFLLDRNTLPPPPSPPIAKAEPHESDEAPPQIMEEVAVKASAPVLEAMESVPLPPAPVASSDKVWQPMEVEKQPEFPGGKDALGQFLGKNMSYPLLARENGIQGMVVVKFIIEPDGALSNAALVRDIGGGCGKEALRLVQAMPRWSPGMKNGVAMRVQWTQPMKFSLH